MAQPEGQRLRVVNEVDAGEVFADAVARVVRGQRLIVKAGLDEAHAATWAYFASLRPDAFGVVRFTAAESAVDMTCHATTLVRRIDGLDLLGIVQWLTRARGTLGGCEVRVNDPEIVLADDGKTNLAVPPDQAAFRFVYESERPSPAHAPMQVWRDDAPVIRAHAGMMNDLNEQNDEDALGALGEAALPHAQLSPHSVHSPRAPLSIDERDELADRVLNTVGDIVAKLRNPPKLYPWIPFVAAYLQHVSGVVSQWDIERIVFAATHPGDAARTKAAGVLFVGGLKALIFERRAKLAAHPLFVGTALDGVTVHKAVRLPRLNVLRSHLAELGIDLDPRSTRPPQQK